MDRIENQLLGGISLIEGMRSLNASASASAL